MLNVFSYQDYRGYLQERIRSLPKEGRGELIRIAKAAGIHPSVLSQIFQGHRHFTHEQAASVSEYLGLSDVQARYFLLLVQLERAGTKRLRELVQAQIDELRTRELQLSSRLPKERVLSDKERALFYCNWYYSAARVLSSIPPYQTIEALASRLGLPRSKVAEVVQFLLENSLCVERNGKIEPGPQSTHLEATSPLVSRHHSNWRVKAMDRHPALSADRELAYSSPMSLSQKDVIKVKERLISAIQDICQIIDPSPSEVAYCLNIDWFEF